MRITSPAFRHGEFIPRQYSRYGEDKSPPLDVEDVPANTRSLVSIVDDPDAPRGLFTHWVVFDLDPKTADIVEDHAPENARQGSNSWGETQYGGPQPPSGEHRYVFRVHALDTKLDLPRGSTRAEVERAMSGHALEAAELMGRYAAEEAVAARWEPESPASKPKELARLSMKRVHSVTRRRIGSWMKNRRARKVARVGIAVLLPATTTLRKLIVSGFRGDDRAPPRYGRRSSRNRRSCASWLRVAPWCGA
jgi:Raf kinase inhibitor-like YbhB/YbcL family protein